jgi:hypothetical protein
LPNLGALGNGLAMKAHLRQSARRGLSIKYAAITKDGCSAVAASGDMHEAVLPELTNRADGQFMENHCFDIHQNVRTDRTANSICHHPRAGRVTTTVP